MQYDLDELEEMGATYRPGPGLTRRANEEWADVVATALEEGYGPVCIRFVVDNLSKAQAGSILDFGCGLGTSDGAVHVQALRLLGYDCVGYEWEPEDDDETGRAETYDWAVEEGLVDPDALGYAWDTVVANNVLNVQPSWDAMFLTLEDLKSCMDEDTLLVVNMPSNPRRLQSDGAEGLDETHELLAGSFEHITELEPGLWACYRPRAMSRQRWSKAVKGL
jgi:hypothetical protein